MSIKRSDLTWISVSDLKKATHFFSEILGMKISQPDTGFGWVELIGKEGGSLIGLAQMTNKGDPHNPVDHSPGMNAVVTFTVDDLDKTIVELSKKGVEIVGDVCEVPGVVKMQFFRDPDGNLFQFCQELDKH